MGAVRVFYLEVAKNRSCVWWDGDVHDVDWRRGNLLDVWARG